MVLSARWIYLKAALFLLIAALTAALLLLRLRDLEGAALLAICLWSTARLYYFAFYVIEKYIDPSFKFAGLLDALKYLFSAKEKHRVTEFTEAQRKQNQSLDLEDPMRAKT